MAQEEARRQEAEAAATVEEKKQNALGSLEAALNSNSYGDISYWLGKLDEGGYTFTAEEQAKIDAARQSLAQEETRRQEAETAAIKEGQKQDALGSLEYALQNGSYGDVSYWLGKLEEGGYQFTAEEQ